MQNYLIFSRLSSGTALETAVESLLFTAKYKMEERRGSVARDAASIPAERAANRRLETAAVR